MTYGALAAIIISSIAGFATVVGGGASILASRHITPLTFAAALAFAAGCTLTVAFADILPEGQEAFNHYMFYRNHAKDAELPEEEEHRNYSYGLLVMLIGWLVGTLFDKALHGSLDLYERRRRGSNDQVVHVGVCAHDHQHPNDDAQSRDLTSPIMNDTDQILSVVSCDSFFSHNNGQETIKADAGGSFWALVCKGVGRIFVGKSNLTASEQRQVQQQFKSDPEKISRLGYFTATVLALHNLPEGIALYGTVTSNAKAGLGLASGIALHNLPQGMAIAVPIYVGLKSGWKAIAFCAAAAIAQPLGAILGYAIVGPSPSDKIMSIMLLLTAGILFNASLKELYGAAIRYDKGNQVSGSFMFIGMLIMSLTLVVLAHV